MSGNLELRATTIAIDATSRIAARGAGYQTSACSDGQGPTAVLRGGAYDSPLLGATCDFRSTRVGVNVVLPTVGFRCCKATAP
jgi:formylglycine-generating enzyme required for sulfatase activity